MHVGKEILYKDRSRLGKSRFDIFRNPDLSYSDSLKY